MDAQPRKRPPLLRLDRLDQEVQPLHAVEPWIGILLQRLLSIYAQLRKATQENAERDLGFQTSQGSSQAEVDTFAKADVRIGVSIDKELVRVLELALVVVGRVQLDHEHLLRGDHLPSEPDFGSRYTTGLDNRAAIPEHLFDRHRNRRWIGAQCLLGVGMLIQT